MGRLWTGVGIVVAMAAVAACHGRDPDGPIDADVIDDSGFICDGGLFCTPPIPACNPAAAAGLQGCGPGLRCVWQIIAVAPEQIGRLACLPDTGTAGLGEACTPASLDVPDTCVGGLACVGGTCLDVCGFDGSAGSECASAFNCTRIDGLFHNGADEPSAGVCNPGCDPVTQLRIGGGSCGPGQGCYLLTSQTETFAVCAGAGNVGHGVAITGQAFANSCVPGAQPRRRDLLSDTVECGGLCRPADVTSASPANEGGVPPDDCQGKWGAAPPSDSAAGESCRYWWAREPFQDLSPFSNSVGWCFKHTVFQYDTDGDMTPDTPMPRCPDVTTGDVLPPVNNPPQSDAEFFWCTARSSPLTGPPSRPRVHLDRFAPVHDKLGR